MADGCELCGGRHLAPTCGLFERLLDEQWDWMAEVARAVTHGLPMGPVERARAAYRHDLALLVGLVHSTIDTG